MWLACRHGVGPDQRAPTDNVPSRESHRPPSMQRQPPNGPTEEERGAHRLYHCRGEDGGAGNLTPCTLSPPPSLPHVPRVHPPGVRVLRVDGPTLSVGIRFPSGYDLDGPVNVVGPLSVCTPNPESCAHAGGGVRTALRRSPVSEATRNTNSAHGIRRVSWSLSIGVGPGRGVQPMGRLVGLCCQDNPTPTPPPPPPLLG